jgi:hypothetical protein
MMYMLFMSRYSSVSIVTGYELDDRGSILAEP